MACDIIAELGDHPGSHRFPWDRTDLSYWPNSSYGPDQMILDAVMILEGAEESLSGRANLETLGTIIADRLADLSAAFDRLNEAFLAFRKGQLTLDPSYRPVVPMMTRLGRPAKSFQFSEQGADPEDDVDLTKIGRSSSPYVGIPFEDLTMDRWHELEQYAAVFLSDHGFGSPPINLEGRSLDIAGVIHKIRAPEHGCSVSTHTLCTFSITFGRVLSKTEQLAGLKCALCNSIHEGRLPIPEIEL